MAEPPSCQTTDADQQANNNATPLAVAYFGWLVVFGCFALRFWFLLQGIRAQIKSVEQTPYTNLLSNGKSCSGVANPGKASTRAFQRDTAG